MDDNSIHEEAQRNFKEWMDFYDRFKTMLQNVTDEEFEQCVQVAIQQGNVGSENKLREVLLSIRNETNE